MAASGLLSVSVGGGGELRSALVTSAGFVSGTRRRAGIATRPAQAPPDCLALIDVQVTRPFALTAVQQTACVQEEYERGDRSAAGQIGCWRLAELKAARA